MTISTAISQSGSSTTGTILPADKTPKTTANVVAILEIKPPTKISIPRSKPLRSLMQEFEADPQMAARLAAARRDLAATLSKGDAPTLRTLRLSLGLSQDQVAAKMKTAQSHIAKIEQGRTDPGTDTIAGLAEALGLKPEVVFAAVRAQRAPSGER